MKKSFVLEHNKEIMVLNWIKNYCWNSKLIKDSLIASVHYYATMEDVEKDIITQEIKQFIVNYANELKKDVKTLEKWIEKTKFTWDCKTFTQLMNENELPFKTKNELHEFIQNNF